MDHCSSRRAFVGAAAAALVSIPALYSRGDLSVAFANEDPAPSDDIMRITCENGFNCYLIEGEDGCVLVDTLSKDFPEVVIDACEGKDVGLIVLTHAHWDHCGSAAILAEHFGCPIALCKSDENLITDNWAQPVEANEDAPGSDAFLERVTPGLQGAEFDAFAPDFWLQDGDSLEGFGVDATIVALPGHTLGSVGVDVHGTDLIVGDTLINNQTEPLPALIVHDKPALVASMNKIAALGPRTILYGHGDPTANWLDGKPVQRVLGA